MIVPLLKDKHGDASRLDMFRGITLSSTASKLFESVLVAMFGNSLQSSKLHFGFTQNSSCRHAVFTFNESVKYLINNGSRGHCVALDASKAFDKLLHYGSFYRMLSSAVLGWNVCLVTSSVQYCGTQHWVKDLRCSGVRQGGTLSLYLFALYINDMIDDVKKSSYDIHIRLLNNVSTHLRVTALPLVAVTLSHFQLVKIMWN